MTTAKPVCAKCGNDGVAAALYMTIDARWHAETSSFTLVERDDAGGRALDCLACDHSTPEPESASFFPYGHRLPVIFGEAETSRPRWVVVPERDTHGPELASVAGTRFEQCDEADAMHWAVYQNDGLGLVEDYPTRAAAVAAVAALVAGEPLPDPVWPD